MKFAKTQNKYLKLTAAFMSVTLFAAIAAPLTALASTNNTPKEEVVYINLDPSGSVKEINVVNIFELDKDGKIVDYGNYESLRNMTTTDEIKYSGDTVNIDAKSGKLYYEGKLTDNTMPWNISVKYYMDDKEYTADQLFGMSGKLKIAISIKKNESYDGTFFDGYALQASLTLDTDKCSNIVANGATVANVGGNKQITYTILPGKETDLEITADAIDFEMSSISINGIPLSINIDVEDEDLMSQVTKLVEAIDQLDDGAGEIKNGTSKLKDSITSDLQGGAANLQDGATAIDTGINQLNSGILQIDTALKLLNTKSSDLVVGSAAIQYTLVKIQTELNGLSVTSENLTQLVTASSGIKSGIDSIVNNLTTLQQNLNSDAYKASMKQNGLDIDALKQSNTEAINNIQALISSLNDQINSMKNAGADTQELEEQVNQLENISALLAANNASMDGTETYLSTINSNITSMLDGAKTLQNQYASFDSTIENLVNTMGSLPVELSKLTSAINELVSKYSQLDDGINEYTNGVAEIIAGYSQITQGAANLVSGSGELKNGTDSLYEGTDKLLENIVKLYAGTMKIKDGTSALRGETSGMDTEISDKIDALLDSISGENTEIVSFVSEKNTNVKAVQFVIQTEAIENTEEISETAVEEEELNFWQKLLKLFGIN